MKSISSYFVKTNNKSFTTNNIQQNTIVRKEDIKKDKTNKLYEYYPREFINYNFDDIYNEIKSHLRENSSRKTCVCTSKENLNKRIYDTLNKTEWTPIIEEIKTRIEEIFGKRIDYGLVQYYENGDAYIGWHNDKEAYETYVFCVSFGAIRTFVFRDIETKKRCDKISLISGDLIYMKDGCQKFYEHAILKEQSVNYPRVSLTFRSFEK